MWQVFLILSNRIEKQNWFSRVKGVGQKKTKFSEWVKGGGTKFRGGKKYFKTIYFPSPILVKFALKFLYFFLKQTVPNLILSQPRLSINQSVNLDYQSINQTLNQSIKHSIKHSINQSNTQSINQSNTQSINQQITQPINQKIN